MAHIIRKMQQKHVKTPIFTRVGIFLQAAQFSVRSLRMIQFRVFLPGAVACDSSIRGEVPRPGFPNLSRGCLSTLYQFPHEQPARCSSFNGKYEGINLDGKLFTVGLSAERSRETNGNVSVLRSRR